LRPRIEFLLLIAGVSHLRAQVAGGGRDVDLRYGHWYQGNQSTTYELRTDKPLSGIFSHGFVVQAGRQSRAAPRVLWCGLAAARVASSRDGRALSARWRLARRVDRHGVTGPPLWIIGGESVASDPGRYEAETSYRLQDVGPRGFWRAVRIRATTRGVDQVSLTIGKSVDRRGPSPRASPMPHTGSLIHRRA
jgi:hypothetical protein